LSGTILKIWGNKVRSWSILVLGLVLLTTICQAQALDKAEEIEDPYEYHSEFAYGINFNTNAGLIGGGMLKYVVARNLDNYQGVYAELAHVKNPKEERVTNPTTTNSFIYLKQNYLIPLRVAYVREHCLFRKAPEEGVHLNVIYGGGLSLGLVKPYYIQYSPTGDYNTATSVPYNPAIHRNNPNNIVGAGSFFDGFNSLKIEPGLHVRSGLSFEFGIINSSVVGVEAGFVVEKYSQTIIIMDKAPNRSLYTSGYITFYYGRKR
jgi:hypothetical protein